LQGAVQAATQHGRQAAMKLVELSAVRVQHQRPPGPRHHLGQYHLAQCAAARREVDMRDDGFERGQGVPQGLHRARVGNGAVDERALFHGRHVPEGHVLRQMIADEPLHRADPAAHRERWAELQHVRAAIGGRRRARRN